MKPNHLHDPKLSQVSAASIDPIATGQIEAFEESRWRLQKRCRVLVCRQGGLFVRRGITIVEILVVTAIIGLLVGILLPAVQVARATAAKTQCSNKLRELLLATHNYESVNRSLPSGIDSRSTDTPYSTWIVDLSPYLGDQVRYEASMLGYRHDRLPFGSVAHPEFQRQNRTVTCPSDESAMAPKYTRGKYLVGLTSYVGNAGSSPASKDGPFFLDSRVDIGCGNDGSSNTILYGERPSSPDFWFGWWYAAYGRDGLGSPDIILGLSDDWHAWDETAACPPGRADFAFPNPKSQCNMLSYWSWHPAGANLGFADGSVRFTAYGNSDMLYELAVIRF